MSDDELKALERALAASGGVADRLALARALERAGRADDALEVLLPAREDADVRSEIGRWPAWGMAQGWRNGSSFIDAAPIHNPRVRWRTDLSVSRGARFFGAHLFASPLGVVVRLQGETRTERHTVFLLDPESGTVRRRWDVSPIMFSLDLHGRDLLEPRKDGVFAIDLHTGAERVVLSSESGVRTRSAVVRDGTLVAAREDGAWVFTPDGGDSWLAVWRVPLGERRGLVGHRVRPSGDLIYVTSKNDGEGFAALERATGAERWRSSGQLRQIDAQGAVAHEGPHDSRAGDTATVLFDRTGQRVWAVPGFNYISALTPDHLFFLSFVVSASDRPPAARLCAVTRQTGAEALAPVNGHHFGSGLVIARDQIHVDTEPASGERGEVWAHDLRGRVRWRFELDVDVSVRALVPLHRRLFVLTSQEELICLEETPGRDGEERSTLAE